MTLVFVHAGLAGTVVPAIILDTDMSIDVDDVGALCIAHALADAGEATLLAVVHDTALKSGVGAISAINRYYERNVPVGKYNGTVGDPATTPGPGWTNHGQGTYVDDLVAGFPTWISHADEAPTALQVYLRALEAADNSSVTIVSVGFVTNLLDLLRSNTGVALIKQKVRVMVLMGGEHGGGAEWKYRATGLELSTHRLAPNLSPAPYIRFGLLVGTVSRRAGTAAAATVPWGVSLTTCWRCGPRACQSSSCRSKVPTGCIRAASARRWATPATLDTCSSAAACTTGAPACAVPRGTRLRWSLRCEAPSNSTASKPAT